MNLFGQVSPKNELCSVIFISFHFNSILASNFLILIQPSLPPTLSFDLFIFTTKCSLQRFLQNNKRNSIHYWSERVKNILSLCVCVCVCVGVGGCVCVWVCVCVGGCGCVCVSACVCGWGCVGLCGGRLKQIKRKTEKHKQEI